jgi:aerobic-type carbon monoxide dehydrogenase small subunit (CoxS/CutS family)
MSPLAASIVVNGVRHEVSVEPRKLLSDFLRQDLELKGVKVSCDIGICGACRVIMGGRTVRACLTFAIQADGQELVTVEGLADGDTLSPIQEAFWDCHALQCGYCTPGMLITAHQLLQRNNDPSEEEIRQVLNGNLCRCTGYVHIVQAIRLAAERMRAGQKDCSSA